MKHVKKRGNVYYYRRAVPTDLREAIGRNEFVVRGGRGNSGQLLR